MGLMLSRLQILVSCAAATSLGLSSCMTESPEAKSADRIYFISSASMRAATAQITNCGACNGPVVRLKTVPIPRVPTQSKNSFVWNDSICGNLLIGPESLICRNCWHVFLPQLGEWTRSLHSASGFVQPLDPSIASAPTPKNSELRSSIAFKQTYRTNRFTDSVLFWGDDDDAFLTQLKNYASTNKLIVQIGQRDRIPGQIHVRISTGN